MDKKELFQIFLQSEFANDYFALVVKIRHKLLFAKINAPYIGQQKEVFP
jgi:hypothetical protein